jgi:hypothetical protein
MVAGKNETVRSAVRKGFKTKANADHLKLQYWEGERKVAQTRVSHGPDEDLGPKRLREMGEQCHLSREQFYDFAKCKMTEEQYRQILVDKGIIKGD